MGETTYLLDRIMLKSSLWKIPIVVTFGSREQLICDLAAVVCPNWRPYSHPDGLLGAGRKNAFTWTQLNNAWGEWMNTYNTHIYAWCVKKMIILSCICSHVRVQSAIYLNLNFCLEWSSDVWHCRYHVRMSSRLAGVIICHKLSKN